MADNEQLGYDAVNDTSVTYESLEGAEKLQASLNQLWQAAQEQGALTSGRRDLEREEGVHDPLANDRGGDIVDKRVPIETPVLESARWLSFTNDEKTQFYHWTVN